MLGSPISYVSGIVSTQHAIRCQGLLAVRHNSCTAILLRKQYKGSDPSPVELGRRAAQGLHIEARMPSQRAREVQHDRPLETSLPHAMFQSRNVRSASSNLCAVDLRNHAHS